MATATFQQTKFTAGQLGESLVGRVDLSKYYSGCSIVENFIPIKQGPVIRRPGTKYVAEVKSSQAGSITASRLIPFIFSTGESYSLEFGDRYIRFYQDRGRLQEDNTVKLVGADSDTPFELETPYARIQSSQTLSVSSITFTAGANIAVSSPTFDATQGKVTLTATAHGMSNGDRALIKDTAAPAGFAEGVFTLNNPAGGANTFIYARPSFAAPASGPSTVQRPDLATVTTSTTHNLSPGDIVDVSLVNPPDYNGRFRVETTPTASTFTYRLETSSTPASASAGTITRVKSDVSRLDYAQSADVLFLAHPNVKPKELQRRLGFGVTAVSFNASDNLVSLTIGTENAPHGFKGNDAVNGIFNKVIVSGMTPAVYNGCFVVEFVTDTNISYTPANTIHYNTTSCTESLGVATITIGTHSVSVGDTVTVAGVIPAGYNGTFTVIGTTSTTISYLGVGTLVDATTQGTLTIEVTGLGTVDGWQIVDYVYRDGPYLELNESQDVLITNDTTVRPKTATASSSESSDKIFAASDEDRVFRHWDGPNWRWGRIVWFESDTVVRFVDEPRMLGDEPNSNRQITGTNDLNWRLGAWSWSLGWPGTINFIQNRAMWGGNAFAPQTFWLTTSSSIIDFAPNDFGDFISVTDASAITATIDDNLANTIFWLALTPQGMLIGTGSAEFLLQQRAKLDPLTPSNTVVSAQSFLGSKQFVKPVKAGNTAVLFVQRSGRQLHQMLFDIDTDGLKPRDITQLAGDIAGAGIAGLSYQQDPNPIVWAYLEDGTLIGCTYEIDEEVIAWHKHPLGGTNAKVKSMTTIPDDSQGQTTTQLWMIVERTIDGATVQYVEFVEDRHETGDELKDAIYMDSSFTYDSTATTTISGLDHLEGETVKVFADGVVQTDKTVSSGSITISSASTVQVGLSYTSTLATMPIALRQAQPDSYQKINRLERANISLIDSQGVEFGLSLSELDPIEFDDSTSLHTGLVEDINLDSSYERSQKLFIVNSSVFPTTVRSIEIELEVQPVQD